MKRLCLTSKVRPLAVVFLVPCLLLAGERRERVSEPEERIELFAAIDRTGGRTDRRHRRRFASRTVLRRHVIRHVHPRATCSHLAGMRPCRDSHCARRR